MLIIWLLLIAVIVIVIILSLIFKADNIFYIFGSIATMYVTVLALYTQVKGAEGLPSVMENRSLRDVTSAIISSGKET